MMNPQPSLLGQQPVTMVMAPANPHAYHHPGGPEQVAGWVPQSMPSHPYMPPHPGMMHMAPPQYRPDGMQWSYNETLRFRVSISFSTGQRILILWNLLVLFWRVKFPRFSVSRFLNKTTQCEELHITSLLGYIVPLVIQWVNENVEIILYFYEGRGTQEVLYRNSKHWCKFGVSM